MCSHLTMIVEKRMWNKLKCDGCKLREEICQLSDWVWKMWVGSVLLFELRSWRWNRFYQCYKEINNLKLIRQFSRIVKRMENSSTKIDMHILLIFMEVLILCYTIRDKRRENSRESFSDDKNILRHQVRWVTMCVGVIFSNKEGNKQSVVNKV